MNELVTAGIGLLGTALGGAISWVSTERRGRTQTAWEMHREFTGEAMSRSRAVADRIMRRHPGVRWDELAAVVPADELDHLWQVTSFYERLALAVEHGRINPTLVAPLFGDLFIWWYVVGFEPHYVMLDWSTARHVQQLKLWLDRHAPAVDRRHWQDKAERSRNAYVRSQAGAEALGPAVAAPAQVPQRVQGAAVDPTGS